MYIKIITFMVAVVGFTLLSSASAYAVNADIYASPHPDDETQMWSQVERSAADSYKIFAYFTGGEESSHCAPNFYNDAFQPQYGEVAPNPVPSGARTASCVQARLNSMTKFFNDMAKTNPNLPSGFDSSETNNPLYTHISNLDGQPGPSNVGFQYDSYFGQDDSVRIYRSANNKGMILVFHMGDADLNSHEVVWGIEAVKSFRNKLTIPTGVEFNNIYGSFYNAWNPNCVVYAHSDHLAVHEALWSHDFNLKGRQKAASCKSDSDVSETHTTNGTTWDNAWGMRNQTRFGAAQKRYGWLNGDTNGWKAVSSSTSQVGDGHPFMRLQSFWSRY